jgi:hypothetical protein
VSAKIAKNLERFRMAVSAHDRNELAHSPAHGIGVAQFDLERMGFEEGETLWGSITIHADGKTSGNFRVLCDGEHDGQEAAETRTDVVEAIGAMA